MKSSTHISENPFCGRDAAISNFCGNEAFYEKHLAKFIQNYNAADTSIEALIASGNLEEAHRLAHSIKGLSRSFGLLSLGDAAQNLESAIKSDTEIPHYLNTFSTELRTAISAYINTHPS